MDTEKETSGKEVNLSYDRSPASSSQSSEESFDWKTHRKTKAIIDSLKKRVGPNGRRNTSSSSGSETLEEQRIPSPDEGTMDLDRRIEELMPQKRALSDEAKKSVSLVRNKSPFKFNLSYDALACMFKGSVGSSSFEAIESARASVAHSLRSESSGSQKFSSENSEVSVAGSCESETFEPETARDTAGSTIDGSLSGEQRNCGPTKPPYKKSHSSPPEVLKPLKLQETEKPKQESNGNEASSRGASQSDKKGNPDRRSLKDASNSSAYAMISSISSSFSYLSTEAQQEIEEALKSPALQKPFRQRSGAVKLKEEERPRSVSSPGPLSACPSESDPDAAVCKANSTSD